MTSKKLTVSIMICSFIIICILAVGCSDDDNPTSPIKYGWAPLGMGTDSYIYELTVFENKLIAGGAFTTAGGMSANRIAAWNDSAWTPLGTGFDYGAFSLTVFDSTLIAGGRLTTAGGVSASGIAAWDGLSWAPLGTGLDKPGDVARVHTLTVFDTKLIAGGIFTVAGGVSASCIASWNGSSWAPLGTGMGYPASSSGVFTLTVFVNHLIAGGWFSTAGGVAVNNIAAWDGSSWMPLGTGLNNIVQAFTVYKGKLIAGGEFSTAGGVSANHIAAWDGSSWTPLGTGINGNIYALTVYDNKLIAGGEFSTAGGVAANRIATWDGSSWAPLGTGMDNSVSALTVFNNKLIVGGNFTTAGGVSANHIAVWGPK